MQSTREMSAFLTSRDYALRLALALVIATEAALFGLLILLNGGFDRAPQFSSAILLATIALVAAALSRARLPRMLAFGATALVAELASLPSHGKLVMLIAGLHAAEVAAGCLLVAWALALPRWRRDHLARLTSRYWYFVTIAWLAVAPLVSAHRS